MKRLVVVSNRVANLNNPAQAGGLAVGLGDALRQNQGLWFGWDGRTVARSVRVPADVQQVEGATTVTLAVSPVPVVTRSERRSIACGACACREGREEKGARAF